MATGSDAKDEPRRRDRGRHHDRRADHRAGGDEADFDGDEGAGVRSIWRQVKRSDDLRTQRLLCAAARGADWRGDDGAGAGERAVKSWAATALRR